MAIALLLLLSYTSSSIGFSVPARDINQEVANRISDPKTRETLLELVETHYATIPPETFHLQSTEWAKNEVYKKIGSVEPELTNAETPSSPPTADTPTSDNMPSSMP